MYASQVLRLFVVTTLLLALGCRAPKIPTQPSAREYAVYSAWIEHASVTFPPQLSFAVDASTLTLDQDRLQFKQCLPRRMDSIFDEAPDATLTSTSNHDWITLSNGRPAQLLPPSNSLPFTHSAELFRLSRVAFTRLGSDAYLWVERRTCRPGDTELTCEGASGKLLHGMESGDTWTFEDTTCQTIFFPN